MANSCGFIDLGKDWATGLRSRPPGRSRRRSRHLAHGSWRSFASASSSGRGRGQRISTRDIPSIAQAPTPGLELDEPAAGRSQRHLVHERGRARSSRYQDACRPRPRRSLPFGRRPPQRRTVGTIRRRVSSLVATRPRSPRRSPPRCSPSSFVRRCTEEESKMLWLGSKKHALSRTAATGKRTTSGVPRSTPGEADPDAALAAYQSLFADTEVGLSPILDAAEELTMRGYHEHAAPLLTLGSSGFREQGDRAASRTRPGDRREDGDAT